MCFIIKCVCIVHVPSRGEVVVVTKERLYSGCEESGHVDEEGENEGEKMHVVVVRL